MSPRGAPSSEYFVDDVAFEPTSPQPMTRRSVLRERRTSRYSLSRPAQRRRHRPRRRLRHVVHPPELRCCTTATANRPYDLAIFDQGMWLITHFHVPFVTVMGRNLFGDHTSFVLVPLRAVLSTLPRAAGSAGLADPVAGRPGGSDLRAGAQVHQEHGHRDGARRRLSA